MSNLIQEVFTQQFTNSDEITVAHNFGALVAVIVKVDEKNRYDLIQSVIADSDDPNDKLVVKLKTPQSGEIVIYSVAGVLSALPSIEVTAALERSKISAKSVIATEDTVRTDTVFITDPSYKEDTYLKGQLVKTVTAAGYINGTYQNPRTEREYTYALSALVQETYKLYDSSGTLVVSKTFSYKTEKVGQRDIIRRYEVTR